MERGALDKLRHRAQRVDVFFASSVINDGPYVKGIFLYRSAHSSEKRLAQSTHFAYGASRAFHCATIAGHGTLGGSCTLFAGTH